MEPTLESPADNLLAALDEHEGIDSPVEEQAEPEMPEEIKKAFEQLLTNARNEDRFIRQNYIYVWRRLEYYWNNVLDIFFDQSTGSWQVPNWDELEDEIPPRLINIYRPHGEAIVAALTVAIPGIIFHPDDAENPDDLEAAQAYRSIVELLALHNEAAMLFIRLIVIFFNQGTAFGYNYYHEDDKFGTISKPTIEFKDIELYEVHCPGCGEPLDGGIAGQQQEAYACPECGYQGPIEANPKSERLPQITGFTDSPKGSICQELFSGLQVKVPAYAKKQEECGYLLLEFVQSSAMLRNIFKERADKINSKRYARDTEQFLKLPLQYADQMPDNASNVSCLWLRPWQFWDLGASEQNVAIINQLQEKYPDGCYALFVDDELMEAVEEKMDAHWTISANPFSTSIYARPLGENLATIQDIRAELTELELQTVEHGISETFADPKVLDFNKYGEGRSKPGMMTQAKPRPGSDIGKGFFQTKAATLSQEVEPFRQSVDQDAQFVVGSFPSIYGGVSEGGSKTASEYSQSRAMALQRLGTVWKLSCDFWANFQSRSAVEFAEVLKEMNRDERFTKREGGTNFVNVWIRSTSLTGRIGRVEAEATEQLPVSWGQKKDAISQLLLSGNEQILAVLTHPNNAELMKEVIGLVEFYIPGEEGRLRQRKEFLMMSQGIPVQTNPLVDNDEVHIQILRSILEGAQGESLSPEVMQLCMQHLFEHEVNLAKKQPAPEAEASNDSKEKTNNGPTS